MRQLPMTGLEEVVRTGIGRLMRSPWSKAPSKIAQQRTQSKPITISKLQQRPHKAKIITTSQIQKL